MYSPKLPTLSGYYVITAMHAGKDPFQELEMSRGAAVRVEEENFYAMDEIFPTLLEKYGYEIETVLVPLPQNWMALKTFRQKPFVFVIVTMKRHKDSEL